MRSYGPRQPGHHAVVAARGLALAALWLAGCSFHPDGLGGGLGAPDTAVADSALSDVRTADVTSGDGEVGDGGTDGMLVDGAAQDAAVVDAGSADAAADAAVPDAFVFMDAMPPPLDAAVPDAFVFMDAMPPPIDAAIPDATVFMDAATGPGPGELWSTPAAQAPVIDGNLDTSPNEWPRARCITVNPNNLDHVDDLDRAIVTKPGVDDSSGFFCSQWTSAGLYVAARVRDDTHQSNSFDIYNDDSVAFYLDGDDTRDGTVDANDHAFMVAPGFIGTRTGDFFHNGGLANGIDFSASNTSGADMDIEGFLPWAALAHATPPVTGARLGFDFVIADDDDQGGLFQSGSNDVDMDLWWYRRTVAATLCTGHEDVWCNPALMGEVVLK